MAKEEAEDLHDIARNHRQHHLINKLLLGLLEGGLAIFAFKITKRCLLIIYN